VQFVVIHPHDYADPTFASVLVDEMRCQAGVRAEHRVGDDYIFELEPEKQ
jgi:hypothetical protein